MPCILNIFTDLRLGRVTLSDEMIPFTDKMNTSPRPEDRRSEERITKILNDAAGSPYGSLKQEDSKSPSLPSNQQVNKLPTD